MYSEGYTHAAKSSNSSPVTLSHQKVACLPTAATVHVHACSNWRTSCVYSTAVAAFILHTGLEKLCQRKAGRNFMAMNKVLACMPCMKIMQRSKQ